MENKENEMKEEGFYKYYELHTEYGPLYLYERFEKDPDKKEKFEILSSVMREFFTGEECVWDYTTIDFLEGAARFRFREMSMWGYPLEGFMDELQPYDFLMKVAPYLEDEETKQDKARKVHYIIDCKAKKIANTNVIKKEPEVSEHAKNEVAKTLLKKYVK